MWTTGALREVSRATWIGVAAILAPWTWFLVRDLLSIFDVVAIFLPPAIVVVFVGSLVMAAAMRSLLPMMAAGSLALFFIAAVVSPGRPADRAEPTDGITVAAMNLGLYWFSDNDAGFLLFEQDPDLLVGTELTESHDAEFTERFTHREAEIITLEQMERGSEGADSYRQDGLPSIGVYSKFPIERLDDPIADTIEGGMPGMRLRVEAPDLTFVLYALHIPRPGLFGGSYEVSPGEQHEMIDAITAAIDDESMPVVVLGDLNASDRTTSYRKLTADLVDGMRSNAWALRTSDRPPPWSTLLLRIDHLLHTDDLCTGDQLALDTRFSDHRPIVARIGPCPS